ncbi:hypothetical protein [Limnoglobus roseus]|uniref:Uncharacterized protein n=1 Tax=Limnoglobus roseus TaxID=2598579 RepID=A0A5C1A3P1_9BACT|nr:hypothetical protein [Limnoglobus roseus]QEL13699.1 hypothetical protein PX52LOC_00557 [Limnoglobus roseus]
MGTTYTVTRTIKCWKRHECLDCGCEYRYQFERKIKGQGSSEAAALKAANKNVDKAVGTEVDVRPCPTCGRVQPDMVGQGKANGHSGIGLLTIPLAALVYTLGATYVLGGNLASIILAAILTGVALINLMIARGNPNRDRDANVAEAEKLLDAGTVETVAKGDDTKVEPAPAPMGLPHWLGIGFGLLAVLVALAPMIYQTINNLPFNVDTKPDVVSPGNEVKVYFPDSIDCVKSYWRGSAVAAVLNANELGGPVGLTASSNDSQWSNSIYAKNSEKHTHPSLWARVRIPSEARLTGKTLKVKVVMVVQYPSVNASDKFEPQQTTIAKDFAVTLAPIGAGQAYSRIWNGGVIVAGLLAAGSCFYLRSLNKQLQRTAIPPVIDPIEDEDEDQPGRPDNEDDEDDRPRRGKDDDRRRDRDED